MTRKEQNKILDDKTESNNNQYKIDRLNAEISAFSGGDLNKYEFLTRKDLKYKPNALDKARFEFSPLDKAFSMGLDKTAKGYQEEGVIKLLKDIRDGLADRNYGNNDNNDNNNNDDDDDNDDKTFNVLNKFNDRMENDMHNLYKKGTDKENKWSAKLDKLNNDVKKLNNYIKENNDKIINIEKKLDNTNNEYNNLLLGYTRSKEELMRTKNELFKTKNELDKAGNDINEKTKHINKLEKIQEEFNYQGAKLKLIENE